MNRAQRPPVTKVFVEGRYLKHCRDLPQTVFFCPDCKGHPRRRKDCERCEGFGKLTRDSVQELIGWVLGAALKTRKNKFHGAGREDVNVRMLGAGRPFVMEFQNPKEKQVDLAAIEAEINRRNEGRLEVRGLHWTEKGRVRAVKESRHAKEYMAAIEVEHDPRPEVYQDKLMKRIQLVQRTPQRVAHRRADLERERWLELVSLEKIAEGRWNVHLRTQHGTYVKEAISGEGGSTVPSISGLLETPCECLELDVLEILDEEGRGLGVPGAAAEPEEAGSEGTR